MNLLRNTVREMHGTSVFGFFEVRSKFRSAMTTVTAMMTLLVTFGNLIEFNLKDWLSLLIFDTIKNSFILFYVDKVLI